MQCGAAAWLVKCRALDGAGADQARPTSRIAERSVAYVPVRALTHGPKFHWFGYYDKLQFDPSSRYVLGMEVEFEHRSPRPDDVITIGMVDTAASDKWVPLGRSSAWCWQQGCMLQWLPGSDRHIIWNDRQHGRFVSRLLDVKSGKRRTLPSPIYAISPTGRMAVSVDFARLQAMRPGYGYVGLTDRYRDELAPDQTGIFTVDLESGETKLILSLAQIAQLGKPQRSMREAKHYVNHLLFNSDGSRFVFLHRWRPGRGRGPFLTRMITANPDGTEPYVLADSGHTSHFIWREAEQILAWTRPAGRSAGFYLFGDRRSELEPVGQGVMTGNGHCSYLPGAEWILNDTYPLAKTRRQRVYLFHVPTGRKVVLGEFYSPPEYRGEWRCDTHPRYSPNGRYVVIDSAHGGTGRQLWLLDISEVTAS